MKNCIYDDDYGFIAAKHNQGGIRVCELKWKNLQLNLAFIRCSARAHINTILSRNCILDGAINILELLSMLF